MADIWTLLAAEATFGAVLIGVATYFHRSHSAVIRSLDRISAHTERAEKQMEKAMKEAAATSDATMGRMADTLSRLDHTLSRINDRSSEEHKDIAVAMAKLIEMMRSSSG